MPAHQHRTTTGSVPQLRAPKICHSTFEPWRRPANGLTWSLFCSSHAYWKSDRRSDRNPDRPTDGPMLRPGLRPRNCPTDTTTDRTTDTRKVGHKLGPQLGPSDGPYKNTITISKAFQNTFSSTSGLSNRLILLYKMKS
jgi:hypothetical protein